MILSLSAYISINPNSGNLQCAIKCASSNAQCNARQYNPNNLKCCGAFYYEKSICHIARSAELRKPWLGSVASKSVYIEEAKWLSNNKLMYSIGVVDVFQEPNACMFPHFLCRLGFSNQPNTVCIYSVEQK